MKKLGYLYKKEVVKLVKYVFIYVLRICVYLNFLDMCIGKYLQDFFFNFLQISGYY